MAVFGSHLYAFVSNEDGIQAWRTSNGTEWNRVDGGAFGSANIRAPL